MNLRSDSRVSSSVGAVCEPTFGRYIGAGRFAGKLEPATAAAGAEGAAEQCVRAAVEPALKALNTVRDAFATKLTITVK